MPIEISSDDDEVKVVAEVPGYTADDIDIRLEPTRLVIRGNVESEQEEQHQGLSYSERISNEIFRAVYLPTQVDSENANAVIRDGILEITLPRIEATKAKRVQVQAA